jgi:PPOX class probable F420-dependent enzyme
MTPSQIADFLETSRKIVVSSVDRYGLPHLATVYFTVLDGRITFWSYARSQKIVNLIRDPRVAVLTEEGDSYETFRGVAIRGVAQIIDDPAEVVRIGMALAQRYDHELTHDADALAARAVKRVAVSVVGRQTASWDHRRLSRRGLD